MQSLDGSHTGADEFVLTRIFRFGKRSRGLELFACGLLRSFIQSEERVTSLHLFASAHAQRFQRPGKRRRNINELTFDITLETALRRVTATADQEKQQQCASGAH